MGGGGADLDGVRGDGLSGVTGNSWTLVLAEDMKREVRGLIEINGCPLIIWTEFELVYLPYLSVTKLSTLMHWDIENRMPFSEPWASSHCGLRGARADRHPSSW